MKRIASSSSADLEKAWDIVRFLDEKCSGVYWKPPVKFCILLPEPGKIEIWTKQGFSLTPEETVAVKSLLKTHLQVEKNSCVQLNLHII